MRNSKNVLNYLAGQGTLSGLRELLLIRKDASNKAPVVFLVDQFFYDGSRLELPEDTNDFVLRIDTVDEPTTQYVDSLVGEINSRTKDIPCAIVGIGGGIALDCGKAVANLLTNGGSAADYQGWDLVKKPAIYKIGIPTVSGTGAEASRTCVMTNKTKNLKLGMNSEHSIYDQLILDPVLTETVPRDQYFYSGMDTYIHCIESLRGSHRHSLADAYSEKALDLCREVFLSSDMQTLENREKLMIASYLGGSAIANSFVGIVHPFSAGLSVVLGLHHCLANCVVMNQMEEFYPKETAEFKTMLKKQNIGLPPGFCKDLGEQEFQRLYDSTVIHEKPLSNALGPNYRESLTKDRVISLFKRM